VRLDSGKSEWKPPAYNKGIDSDCSPDFAYERPPHLRVALSRYAQAAEPPHLGQAIFTIASFTFRSDGLLLLVTYLCHLLRLLADKYTEANK